MTIVLLIRHAEAAAPNDILLGRNDDVALSSTGLQRAATLAQRLGRLPISAIWSSPLRRTIHTATPIAEVLALSVQIAPSLNEIDYGRWTGRRLTELESDPDWGSFNRERSRAQIPGGEKIEAVEYRVIAQLQGWAREYPPKLIVAVTHAEIIRIAVLHSLGLSSDCYDQIEIGVCSVSALAFGMARPRVICLNESGELDCLSGR